MRNTIVIAEDEADIRNNLERLLSMEGFVVHAAANGQQALSLVELHLPDLVLSDVTMPEMTGHELVQRIRAMDSVAMVPVVLLTARADRSDLREGMTLGADDYLTKPFRRDELLSSIRTQIQKHDARRLTTQRQLAQAHHLSHFDQVTNLPNRTHFLVLLQNAVAQAPTPAEDLLLVSVGVGNLSQVAEVLGTSPMNACVNALAQRLQQLVARNLGADGTRTTVARIGYERFAVFARKRITAEDAASMAQLVLSELGAPVQIGDEEHFPQVHVGLNTLTRPGDSAESLLARADMALESAIAQAGQRYAVLDAQTPPEFSSAFRLGNDIHRCVERQELAAYFQPQVSTQSGLTTGFECLMRWKHPALGFVSPAEFIPLAEGNGQIIPMGAWILREACRQAAAWPRADASAGLRVAVNLSMRQFLDPHLENHIRQALEEAQLQPQQLELEVTESTAMLDMERTLSLLRRFKSMGMAIAIDDFGTGYSSLAYLRRFPLDVLKIDQSFVRNICLNKEDLAIASAIVSLAHGLGLTLIAEGVETPAQAELLRSLGVEELQGYLYAKPMPASAVADWLQSRSA
ncbi:EAL domain-containing protein [Curvibacter sp. APW13]|uniref:putative bifunctional diguanylate cyclase/phosphodiesterase n=1 Tax=Curvibacter sp. APW13 TaxID=3077236 RepID=UPI0028DF6129|nr:EAL domain-containing protein [Curvibacter sp. APW13]MDT8991529.1 EAL domain-containing protein [Curvibacter sp. APW13]